MSCQRPYSKWLPRTPYVASACYRSTIFDYDKWANQPPEHTWRREIECLKSKLDIEKYQVLLAAADCVDQIEYQLSRRGELWKACGFGTDPATPIHALPSITLCDFLSTHLLDVFVWAFTSENPGDTKLMFYTHPTLHCNPLRAFGYASHFLGFTDEQICETLDGFIQLSATCYPSYVMDSTSISLPPASITEPGNQPLSTNPEQDLSRPHPAMWEDGHQILGHVTTAAAAVEHHSASSTHIISSNLWLLTMSLLFVLNAHERGYASRLKDALRYMSVDSRVSRMLDKMLDFDGKTQTSTRIVMAAIALCRSSTFVFNPEVDLMKFKHGNQLVLSKIIAAVFEYPPATSERSVASEKSIWLHIARLIASVRKLQNLANTDSAIMTTTTNLRKELAVNIRHGLGADLVKASTLCQDPRETRRAPWPHLQQPADNGEQEHHNNDGPVHTQEEDMESIIQVDRTKDDALTGTEDVDVDGGAGQDDRSVANESDFTSDASTTSGDERERVAGISSSQEPNSMKSETGQDNKPRIDKRKCSSDDANTKRICKRFRFSSSTADTSHTKRDEIMKEWAFSVKGSQFSWVPFMEVKLETTEGLPPIEKESNRELVAENKKGVRIYSPPYDNLNVGPQNLDTEVTVLRYVLLEEDSLFHRQWITFPLAWPADCENQKKYAALLIANARPASPQVIVNDANGTDIPEAPPAIFRSTDLACFDNYEVDADERMKWDRLLSDKPLMFIPQRRSSHKKAYDAPILNVSHIAGQLRLDVHTKHRVQDTRRFDPTKSDNEHLVAASIDEMVESGRRAMIMPNIPNQTLSSPNIIQHVALDVVGGRLMEGQGFPANAMRWNLCSTQPALTVLRYDAARWATWIRCLKGTKILFVLDGPLPEPGLAEFNIENARFTYFVVEEGSLLVMPSGTPYAVLDVTDCIAEGGHMFLGSGLLKSFDVGLRERMLVDQDTIISHISSEAILHSIWKHYYLAIERVLAVIRERPNSGTADLNISFERLRQYIPFLPSLENLAALIAMCVHADAFEPTLPDGRANPQAPWSLYDQRRSSQSYCERISSITDLWAYFETLENRIEAVQEKNGRPAIERWTTSGVSRPLM